jgi:AcrR family transcriptional regulator
MPPAAPTPPTRRRDPQGTRAAILAAARVVMAERGPDAMTLSEVAHRAGVNRGTAYQHFRNRDELARAVRDDFSEHIARMLRDDRPVGERIGNFLSFFAEHPELARASVYDLLEGHGEGTSSLPGLVERLELLSESGRAQPGIDVEMLGRILTGAQLFWSLWVEATTEGEAERKQAVARYGAELERLLNHGVMRPDAQDTPAPIPAPAGEKSD